MIKAGKNSILLFLICVSFFSISQNATFTFNINGQVPTGFLSTLVTAGEKWSQYLKINVPIKVNVFTVNSSALGFSGVTLANGRQNFTNAPYSNFLYVTALANQIAGFETNPGEYDMDIYFNLSYPFYYGNQNPSNNQMDFLSLAMHEIGHGLGFYSVGYVNTSNIGSFGNIPQLAVYPISTSFPWKGEEGIPTIYDRYLVTESGNFLVNCAAPNSVALGDSIKKLQIYFSGPLFANPFNFNRPLKVESGYGYFSLGEDLLHPYDSASSMLMGYGWGYGDTVHYPTTVELGILKELGWNLLLPVDIKPTIREENSVHIYPNPTNTELFISGEAIETVRIYDSNWGLLLHEFNSSSTVLFPLKLTDLSPGLYFVEIRTKKRSSPIFRRIIKE